MQLDEDNDKNGDFERVDEPQEAPADLQFVTKQASEVKDEITKLESQLKAKKEQFGKLCNTILRTLDLMDIDSIKAHGFLFYKEIKSSVTTPKTPEDKEKLFDFLQQRGIFLEMVSINSMTLNSLYKSLADDAAKEGILDFQLPGVPEPTTYTNLKLRRQ